MPLTLRDRALDYNLKFPNYPPVVSYENWLYGVWMIGNYYKRKHGFYGEFPPSFLNRIYSMFTDKEKILHVFSGMIDKEDKRGGIAVDIDPNLNADIVADVLTIDNLFNTKFNLIIADPPYSKIEAEKYGYPLPNKRLTLRKLAKICESDGFLCWLDLSIPIYRKLDWDLIGTIAVLTGTNRKVRILSIFQR